MGRGQAERLFPLLTELLDEAGLAWADLAAIGVGTGPGNFTGLRIAVAAARGLALSLERPAVGISLFEAQTLGLPRPILSAIAAPRGQVYLQRLGPDGAGTPRLVPEAAARDEAEREGLPLVGGPFADVAASPAPAIARLTALRLDDAEPPARPVPLYVRPPDAAPARATAPTLLE